MRVFVARLAGNSRSGSHLRRFTGVVGERGKVLSYSYALAFRSIIVEEEEEEEEEEG